MAGTDGRDPSDDYENLIKELGLYSPELLKKPMIVAANKMDEEEAVKNLKKFKSGYNPHIMPVRGWNRKIKVRNIRYLQKNSINALKNFDNCPA